MYNMSEVMSATENPIFVQVLLLWNIAELTKDIGRFFNDIFGRVA